MSKFCGVEIWYLFDVWLLGLPASFWFYNTIFTNFITTRLQPVAAKTCEVSSWASGDCEVNLFGWTDHNKHFTAGVESETTDKNLRDIRLPNSSLQHVYHIPVDFVKKNLRSS